MSLTDIARMFEKTHAAVINGLKKHQVYSKYNDYTYKVNTQEYRKIFEAQYIEPRSLKDDILRCTNTTELKLIQERIIMGKYK